MPQMEVVGGRRGAEKISTDETAILTPRNVVGKSSHVKVATILAALQNAWEFRTFGIYIWSYH